MATQCDLAQKCFDIVTQLHSDMSALILSFVDVRTLLSAAQFVSRAWQRAIDGGLPAIWHDVNAKGIIMTKARMADICNKSHGHIRSLTKLHVTSYASHALPTYFHAAPNIRVLHVEFRLSTRPYDFASMLSCLPLLETLSVIRTNDIVRVRGLLQHPHIVFPTMQYLHAFRCYDCEVSGLHNLSALTKLDLEECVTAQDDAWPATVRDVRIMITKSPPHLQSRIAALQQPVAIKLLLNDPPFLTPPHSQFPLFTSLQLLEVGFGVSHFGTPKDIDVSFVAALTSLRDLRLYGCITTNQNLQYISQLSSLQHLTLADIEGVTCECLRHVSTIPNLTSLCLKSMPDAEYSLIALCGQLRKLVIIHDTSKHPYSLSHADASVICQLRHLQKLILLVDLPDPLPFAHLCNIRSLHTLYFDTNGVPTRGSRVPYSVFSALLSLCFLEKLCMPSVEPQDHPKLVDILVQMPTLRRLCLPGVWLLIDVAKRLEDALPKLERLTCHPPDICCKHIWQGFN